MSLVHRQISVVFDLGTGDFGEAGFNRVKLSGPLRASVEITETGGPAFSTCHLSVFGMTLSHMNKLSTLGQTVTQIRRNVVTVQVGDTNDGLSTAYIGQIINGWADFSGMPEVAFRVEAGSAALEAVKPVPPTSFNGLADVAVVMKGLATKAGWIFTNDGVTAKLSNPYFPGTIYDQMRRCAEHADINWIASKGTLAIWPKGAARGAETLLISPQTGLIGYPTFTSSGIKLTCVYSASINYGQRIEVKSSLTPANGIWYIQTLEHHLESEKGGGSWLSYITAVSPGYFAKGGAVTK